MKHFKLYVKIFSGLLLVILFLPCVFINTEKFSEFENRNLAKFPKCIAEDGKFNYNLGKDFENFFKDRFFLRKWYIQFYCDVKYYLSIGYYQLGEVFYNKRYHYAAIKYPQRAGFDGKFYYQPDDIIKNLKILQKFCDENNIKLYIIVPPYKTDIGSKYSYPQAMRHEGYLDILYNINYVNSEGGFNIMYPYEEIRSMQYSEGEPAYYKMDDHWTQKAAHLVYLQFMNQVKKDFPDIKIYELEDLSLYRSNLTNYNPVHGFFNGKYYDDLRLRDKNILDTQYTYIKPYGDIMETHEINTDEGFNRNIYLNKSNKNAPNIFIFGDSYALNLLPGIISSFKNTYDIFTYTEGNIKEEQSAKIKRFEDDLIKNKTDILVVCFVRIIKLRYLYTD